MFLVECHVWLLSICRTDRWTSCFTSLMPPSVGSPLSSSGLIMWFCRSSIVLRQCRMMFWGRSDGNRQGSFRTKACCYHRHKITKHSFKHKLIHAHTRTRALYFLRGSIKSIITTGFNWWVINFQTSQVPPHAFDSNLLILPGGPLHWMWRCILHPHINKSSTQQLLDSFTQGQTGLDSFSLQKWNRHLETAFWICLRLCNFKIDLMV